MPNLSHGILTGRRKLINFYLILAQINTIKFVNKPDFEKTNYLSSNTDIV